MRHKNHSSLKDYVINHILEGILNGTFASGTKIPSERELCRIADVSRVTVRRALQDLAERGAIESQHGSGWKVAYLNSFSVGRKISVVSFVPEKMGLDIYQGIQKSFSDTEFKTEFMNALGLKSLEKINFDNNSGAIIIIGASLSEPLVAELQTAQIPFINAMHSQKNPHYECVTVDHVQSMELMLDFLAGAGLKSIVYLTHEMAIDPSFAIRSKAYIAGMEQRGLKPQHIDIRETNWFDEKNGDMVVDKILLPDGSLPEIVLCTDVMWAEELILNLNRKQTKVPNDMEVAAFGKYGQFQPVVEAAGLNGITCCQFPLEKIGQTCAELLVDKIKGKKIKKLTLIPSEIVYCESTVKH